MIQRLSITAIKLFKACRKAYQLRYVEGLVPAQTSEALETGRGYHEGIEKLYETGELPELSTKEAAMVTAYAKYIMPKVPKFAPEQAFECSVTRGKKLIGRVDGIVSDENAIVEHKTTSKSMEEFEFDLCGDEQLFAYFMATGAQYAYYTVCRKPTIRQKKGETGEEFAQRCLDWYNEDTDSKIKMWRIWNMHLDETKVELRAMFKEIANAEKTGNFYRNTCHCEKWGRRCEYAPICLNYDPNIEYIGFEKRS